MLTEPLPAEIRVRAKHLECPGPPARVRRLPWRGQARAGPCTLVPFGLLRAAAGSRQPYACLLSPDSQSTTTGIGASIVLNIRVQFK